MKMKKFVTFVKKSLKIDILKMENTVMLENIAIILVTTQSLCIHISTYIYIYLHRVYVI